jgi:Tfp pilus assembly protein PilF
MYNKKYKYSFLGICLVLALATFVAFEPVRQNDFVSIDDQIYITKNQNVQDGITRESVIWAFTNTQTGNWHPLTWLSHMLDYDFFDLNPGGHHLSNLLLHIANVLLLFAVFSKMTGAFWPSAFVAAVFALHPLRVESVAWASERKDVLSCFFGLLTIAAYLRYTKCPGIARYLLIMLSFAFSLMAKPMLVTLPCALLLLDYWPLGRFGTDSLIKNSNARLTSYRLVCEKIPLFGLSAAASAATFFAQRGGGAVAPIEELSLNLRIANALTSYATYIGQTIYPHNLAILYPLTGRNLFDWQPVISFAILAVISAYVIYAAGRQRYLLTGWLWYIGILFPVNGLVQAGIQARADRYTYLSSIGIIIMITWGIAELAKKFRLRKIVLAISAAVVLTALLVCTRIQVRHWQNDFTLFGHAAEVTERNYIIHNNFGWTLREKGRLDEAVIEFNKSLQINPNFSDAHKNLALVLAQQDRFTEAIIHYKEVVRLNLNSAYAHNNLAQALLEDKKVSQAVRHFTEAIQLKPDWAHPANSLAWLLATHYEAEFRNPDEAIRLAEIACQLTTYEDPALLDTLAAAYAAAGNFTKAIDLAEKALRLTASSEQNENRIFVRFLFHCFELSVSDSI